MPVPFLFLQDRYLFLLGLIDAEEQPDYAIVHFQWKMVTELRKMENYLAVEIWLLKSENIEGYDGLSKELNLSLFSGNYLNYSYHQDSLEDWSWLRAQTNSIRENSSQQFIVTLLFWQAGLARKPLLLQIFIVAVRKSDFLALDWELHFTVISWMFLLTKTDFEPVAKRFLSLFAKHSSFHIRLFFKKRSHFCSPFTSEGHCTLCKKIIIKQFLSIFPTKSSGCFWNSF